VVKTQPSAPLWLDVSYWSTGGLLRDPGTLKQNFPDLVLEGCSGGGHNQGFRVYPARPYIVTTDTLSSLPDRQSIYDSTLLCLGGVTAYTYENHYNKESIGRSLTFGRCAMMGAWQIDPTNDFCMDCRKNGLESDVRRRSISLGFADAS